MIMENRELREENKYCENFQNYKQDTIENIMLDQIREDMLSLQTEVSSDLSNKINTIINKINNEEKIIEENNEIEENSNKLNEISKSKNGYIFKEKIFKPRNSPIVELYETTVHMKTIYNLVLVGITLLLANHFFVDLIKYQKINLGLNLIKSGFYNFHYFLLCWIFIQGIHLVIYPLFKLWTIQYNYYRNNKMYQKIKIMNEILMITSFIFYISMIALCREICSHVELGILCRFSLIAENTRISMKNHSFIRTNGERAINSRNKTENSCDAKMTNLTFPRYLYFLFSPSFLYRDEYPRTANIRWNYVARHCLEILFTLLLMGTVFEKYIIPYYQNFGNESIKVEEMISSWFSIMLPCIICVLGIWFVTFHSWNNLTAELLRFSDRLYYVDWWNGASYAEWYRNWNMIVHEWLYRFIYKDVYLHISKNSKILSALATFTISAIFHEICLCFAFQFFLPIQFLFFNVFGVAMAFIQVKQFRTIGNYIFWLSFIIGSSFCVNLYLLEHYARENCLVAEGKLFDRWPVIFNCNSNSDRLKDWESLNI